MEHSVSIIPRYFSSSQTENAHTKLPHSHIPPVSGILFSISVLAALCMSHKLSFVSDLFNL